MNPYKFRVTIESDTIKIPELKKFIGKDVEIILLDDHGLQSDGIKNYSKLKKIRGKIRINQSDASELRDISKL